MVFVMADNHPERPNPIGEMYAAVAREVLEVHAGQVIDAPLIEELGRIIAQTECELVGAVEAGELLEVTKQRVSQLKRKGEMPLVAAHVRATPLWLKDDVVEYGAVRPRRPGKPPASR